MEGITDVQSLEEITVKPDGYYWNFPEVLYTWGHGLKHARLVKIQTEGLTIYARMRVTEATVACWQGGNEQEPLKRALELLSDRGIGRLKFLPQTVDLSPLLPGGYKVPVWYSSQSWQDMKLSKNRRWQFKRAAALYDFVPVDDLEEATRILEAWLKEARERQMIMGIGHYRSCIELHPQIPTSRMFFARRKGELKNVGLLGGYVRPPYAVVVNVKHDWSDKWLIHALWGFWMDHVHRELGIELGCNGSTSDNIKRRMRMEKRLYYKPPKLLF